MMDGQPQVLIIAQESEDTIKLQKIFNSSGAHALCYSTLMEAQSFLSGQSVSAVFTEVPLPDGDFQAVRADVERFQKGVPIIGLTREMDWNKYLASMGRGAFDCLALPPNPFEAKRVLSAALQSYSSKSRRDVMVA
jgi:DNA-binding NtrC family response regulator